MLQRSLTPYLEHLFRQYPFVTVTGPRQSGKTTLCRATFPELAYANLEAPDIREFALDDPRGFLARYPGGAILDEVQRAPELLSYLQVIADEQRRNGLFVLTGSEQFRLSDAISQSLAGRTVLLRLLPLSVAELAAAGRVSTVDNLLFSGGYPRIHDQGLDAHQALGDYFETYVERDVRRLSEIRNLASFQRFVRLCAGRVGQLLNVSSLGADAGVSHTTAREWLSLLEASYIVFLLPPHFANIRKRLVKSPKLYFHDVGLASYLIGIEREHQLVTHPLRGPLFENAVISEILKYRLNQGQRSNLTFFRDSQGLECDGLIDLAGRLHAIEVKSGATLPSDAFQHLTRIQALLPGVEELAVVYGGDESQSRRQGSVIPITGIAPLLDHWNG